jgi:PAS domain-containing protein
MKVHLKCIDLGEPFYIRHDATNTSNEHFFLEQIALPIAIDERREVGFILVRSAPLDDKNEVLRTFFDRSHAGLIAAASNHDISGKLMDGRILLINARAKDILKIPKSMSRIHTVRDLGPWFRDGALWKKTSMVAQENRTHIEYREVESGRSYRVSVEPVDRFVLFTIVEVRAS